MGLLCWTLLSPLAAWLWLLLPAMASAAWVSGFIHRALVAHRAGTGLSSEVAGEPPQETESGPSLPWPLPDPAGSFLPVAPPPLSVSVPWPCLPLPLQTP